MTASRQGSWIIDAVEVYEVVVFCDRYFNYYSDGTCNNVLKGTILF